ncbi:MAG: DUF4139 domain-containing protein [Candidatus Zixiibacteriota bacterium]
MKKGIWTLLAVALWSAAVYANDIAVTVYNNNLGVVSETRQLEFKKGTGILAFKDVPSSIDASSVKFELVGSGKNVAILEQNYAYDLVSPETMYNKYVDQDIELMDKEGKLYSGKLMAFSGGAVTLLDKSGKVVIVLLSNITQVTFPSLPDGLITRPTLFWKYNADTGGQFNTRVSYQTGGMSWQAEYVGVLDKTETRLGLSGWASITNSSGKSYADATLKLVAGEINRVQPPMATDNYALRMGKVAMTAEAGGFEQKNFFEYHLYTLPRKATVADREDKQISLFDPSNATVQKIYQYKPESSGSDVNVAVKFKNSKQTGLGMPLPAGRIRMFKADDDGSLILIGEDALDHTPKDEDVEVKIGNAFDISAEERLANQTRVSNQVEDRDYEVEFRNHKDVPVTINVEKKLWGFWDVTKAGFQYKKKDANTLLFDVTVPANDTTVTKYSVRFTTR